MVFAAVEFDAVDEAEDTCQTCSGESFSFGVFVQMLSAIETYRNPVRKIATSPSFLFCSSCSLDTANRGRNNM